VLIVFSNPRVVCWALTSDGKFVPDAAAAVGGIYRMFCTLQGDLSRAQREAFMQGFHSKLGVESSILPLQQHGCFSRDPFKLCFSYLPTRNFMTKQQMKIYIAACGANEASQADTRMKVIFDK
jgi:hypothetical protein